jgi:DNA ligase (NAD+)
MKENNLSKSRIKELVSLIQYHQNAYYNKEAEITDYEFDQLWNELTILDPDNPVLHMVGEDHESGFGKISHVMFMGSQQKAGNPKEFTDWYKRMVSEKENLFIVQYKMDGLSIELQYENGNFIYAVTRGDGSIGDDVTSNIFRTGCVVPTLKKKGKEGFTGAIRGEVLLSHKMKDNFFPTKENCRNAAVGCLKRKDGEGCEYLHIIVYDAYTSTPSYKWSCEEEKVYWLKSTGYDVVHTDSFADCQSIVNYRNEVNVSRKSYEYDIDGIVVKCNSIDSSDMKRDHPRKQIAFKFVLDEVNSILLDVEWSASGKYRTPVAICNPVKISGTTVQRANLANLGLIRKLNLKIGDTVTLVKGGEIIPKIIGVVKTETNSINKEIVPPEKCEFCGRKLIMEGVHVVCPNLMCSERVAHRILHWIEEQGIKFIGDSTVHKLVDKKLISSIADLYEPGFFDILSNKDIVGKAMARKIIDNINNKRAVSLANFVGGLDIDHIGTRLIQSLVKFGFNTLDKIFDATMGDLCMCVGIDTMLAGHIKKGLIDMEDEIYKILLSGVTIVDENTTGVFTGKTACFTGSFRQYSRGELEDMFKKEGGKLASSISKNSSFLVSNDKGFSSGKTVAAKRFNIPIINEEEFLSQLGKYNQTKNSYERKYA